MGGYKIDWGDVGGWISGLGTLGTLAVALRVLVRDRQRDARSQAAKVVCWSETSPPGPDSPHGQLHKCSVFIANHSDAPILSPVVQVQAASIRRLRRSQQPSQPTRYLRKFRRRALEWGGRRAPVQPVLQPGDTGAVHFGTPISLDFFHAQVLFLDGAGRRWRKDADSNRLRPARREPRHGRGWRFELF